MIPLAATQEARATEGAIAPLVLAVLTTYTDHGAETVDRTFYWSAPTPARYPWGGGSVRDFLDVIDATESAIPGATGVGIELPRTPAPGAFPRQAVALTVQDRELAGGETLWGALKARNLHGARLVLAELLLDPRRRLQVGGRLQWDLAGESGTDHTVRFRGELVQVEGRTPEGQITLRFAQASPDLPLVELLDQAENDPRDFGGVLQVPVGAARHVPCRTIRVGWVTTLAGSIDEEHTGTVSFTDLAGIDTSGGPVRAMIDGEEVELDSADPAGNTADITQRGLESTVASEHRAGAVVSEILEDDVLVGVSGAVGGNLRNLFVRDPWSGELVRVTSGHYNYNAADTHLGPPAGIARISPTNMRSLATRLFRNAGVTQQPDFEDTGAGGATTAVRTYSPSNESDPTIPSGDFVHWDLDQTPPHFFLASGTRHAWRGVFTSGDMNGDGGLQVVRWRMKLRVANELAITFDGTLTNSGISGMGGDQLTAEDVDQNDVVEVTSSWRNPSGGPGSVNLNHLVGRYLQFIADFDASGSGQGELREASIQAEVVTSGTIGGGDIERTVDARIVAAAIGFGLRFYADVDGPTIPFEFDPAYAWDEGSGWKLADATHSDQGSAQRFGFATDLRYDFEDHTEFSLATGGGASGSKADSLDSVEGTHSLEVTRSNGTGTVVARKLLASDEDWTGHYLVFAMKAIPAGTLDADYFQFKLHNGTDESTGFDRWNFGAPEGFVAGQWKYLVFDMDDLPPPQASNGTYDPSVTRGIAVGLAGEGVTGSGDVARFDELLLVPKSARAQKNDVGTPDLTAHADRYQVVATAEEAALLASAVIEMEDTAGSGTTQPTDRRELALEVDALEEGQATTLEMVANDEGTPSVGAVQTLAVRLALGALTPAGQLTVATEVALPTVEISETRVALSTTDYAGSPGDVIEHPADVFRWVLTDWMGLPASVLGGALADAEARLAGMKLAGNLLSYGHTLDEVLAGIAFESRSWIFAVERASGTVYQMLTPQAGDYDWPAASVALENLTRLAERLPDRAEVGNHLLGFYGYEAPRGNSEEAFTQVVRATEAENDTSVPDATIAASVVAIGDRRLPPLPLYLIQDDVTAADTLGLYAHLALQEKAALWELPADHWEAFALEPGDLRLVEPAWLGAPAKALVLGATRQLGSTTVRLLLAEVD